MGTNVRFLGTNQLDGSNTSYSFTSASATLSTYLYDYDFNTKLTSSGSDDVTPEVYTASFTSTITIGRIFVANHNIKSGNLQYSDDNQSSWKDFSTAISWSANTDTYNFYEFNEVSGITDLRLTMNTTISANAEKYVGQLIASSEIGELAANPNGLEFEYAENSRIHPTSKGGATYVQFGQKAHMTLSFTDASDADVTILRTLKQRRNPFWVYLNGNDTTKTQEPFRTQDMWLVNYINPYRPNIKNNVVGIGTMIDVELMGV